MVMTPLHGEMDCTRRQILIRRSGKGTGEQHLAASLRLAGTGVVPSFPCRIVNLPPGVCLPN